VIATLTMSLAATACAFGTEDYTAGPNAVSPPDDDAGSEPDAHITKVDSSPPGHDGGGAQKDANNTVDTGTPDTSEPDTSLPDTSLPDTNVPDTNVPDTNVKDTGGGSTCDGLTEWFAGITDQKVKHNGEEYTCKVSGWCSSNASNDVAAYEPGKGWAWTQAWDDSGPCP
jgi:hypothetical protein